MLIRQSMQEDLGQMLRIYEYARDFMARTGNPTQWGPNKWPPEEVLCEDIRRGDSYVCLNDRGKVIGTFVFLYGKDIEPCYMNIEDGKWLDDTAYGVVHRLAGDGSEKGIGAFCLNWAFDQCGHIRIDTHGDNVVMQKLLTGLGYIHCGTIYVEQDEYPRLAYEKSRKG